MVEKNNFGTSWNFVKKLAKVKKFIDSIKTSSLYASFYKVKNSHLALINDKSDFTVVASNASSESSRKNHHLSSTSFQSSAAVRFQTAASLHPSWLDQHIPLFLPHLPILNWFKVWMMAISIVNIIAVSLVGAFQMSIQGNQTMYAMLFAAPFAMFLIEIFVSCNTAYYEEGDIQMNRKKILKNYAKSAMIIDVISTTASYFIYVDGSSLLVFCAVLRILKITSYRRDINEYFYFQQRSNITYTLVNLIATVMMVAHYFACGFNFVAYVEEVYLHNDSWVVTLGIDP